MALRVFDIAAKFDDTLRRDTLDFELSRSLKVKGQITFYKFKIKQLPITLYITKTKLLNTVYTICRSVHTL